MAVVGYSVQLLETFQQQDMRSTKAWRVQVRESSRHFSIYENLSAEL